jgi:hypothetical protein
MPLTGEVFARNPELAVLRGAVGENNCIIHVPKVVELAVAA